MNEDERFCGGREKELSRKWNSAIVDDVKKKVSQLTIASAGPTIGVCNLE